MVNNYTHLIFPRNRSDAVVRQCSRYIDSIYGTEQKVHSYSSGNFSRAVNRLRHSVLN